MNPSWTDWDDDPVAKATGITFNRTPAKNIKAPPGRFRVCAYHVDFDERPVCFVDVATLEEAERIWDGLPSNCSLNVDYGVIYDERGRQLKGAPWTER